MCFGLRHIKLQDKPIQPIIFSLNVYFYVCTWPYRSIWLIKIIHQTLSSTVMKRKSFNRKTKSAHQCLKYSLHQHQTEINTALIFIYRRKLILSLSSSYISKLTANFTWGLTYIQSSFQSITINFVLIYWWFWVNI